MKLRTLCISGVLVTAAFVGCETLRTAKPLMPIKEYERMLVGSFDADYVGTERCLESCHTHDGLRRDFEASTMGAQLSSRSGLPVVDCESCHGPGSRAIEGITSERVAADAEKGIVTECNHETFIQFPDLPPPALSLMCLKCHTGNATFNLHEWNAGAHAVNDVACSNCHEIHAGPDLIVRREETYLMCMNCHQERRAEWQMPSRHPVAEGKVTCIDCHDPHGTTSIALLRRTSVGETCGACHQEKLGPFAIEHADLMDDCTNCHRPHGSIADNLLTATEPYLCLQCHEGHWVDGPGGAPSSLEARGTFFTRCTDCHSTIHGTDTPSATGNQTLQR